MTLISNEIFVYIFLLSIGTAATCHSVGTTETRNVTTELRHVCLGTVVMTTGQESDTIPTRDTVPLRRRIVRLKQRTLALQRQLTVLRDEYIDAKGINEMAISGFGSSPLCYRPLDISNINALSLEREMQLLRQLDQDYATLTSAAGVLTLMREDEEDFEFEEPFTNKLRTARSVMDRVICELFLVIKKLQDTLPSDDRESVHLHVHISDSGYYRPVVKAWCSVSTRFCRHERNAVLLNQLVDFSRVLRTNVRGISM